MFWVYILVYYDAQDWGYYGDWRNFTPNCSVGHYIWSHSTPSYHNQLKQFKNSFAVWSPWIITCISENKYLTVVLVQLSTVQLIDYTTYLSVFTVPMKKVFGPWQPKELLRTRNRLLQCISWSESCWMLSFELQHDKTNKMMCAQRKHRSGKSDQSLQCASWVTQGFYRQITKTDQTGWMLRLIRVFVGWTGHFVFCRAHFIL